MTIIPRSQTLDIAGLVEYQDGSVVSRQITKAKGGNVTLFAFDEGQELSEHTAPYDAFVHMLEGILMPANQPHSVNALKEFKMLLTMIKT
jgi:quercetin dioxygenase-like cupin family protein